MPVVNRASTSTAWPWLRPGWGPTVRRPHPLGPAVELAIPLHPLRARLTAGLVLLACGTVLGLAAALRPEASGFGSHRQLGLGPCSVLALTGYPCPTCGMTTAFAYAVRGRVVAAFQAQPAGAALALTTVVAGLLSMCTIVTGRVCTVNWYRFSPMWVPMILAALILLGWTYKLVDGIADGRFPM